MVKFYYNPSYKYTNRKIIDVSSDTNFKEINYVNIDSPDTINGHIIYQPGNESLPTYLIEDTGTRWFVSGITQLNSHKFQLSLLRDVISENPDNWKAEQAYITAGTATDYNRYKRWNLPYTNTKVGEQRLNFNGKSSFFVFYVNQQQYNDNIITEEDLNISSSIPGVNGADYSVDNFNEIPSFEYVNAGPINYWSTVGGEVVLTYYYKFLSSGTYGAERYYINNRVLTNPIETFTSTEMNKYLIICANRFAVRNNTNNCLTELETVSNNFIDELKSTYGIEINQSQINNLENYVDKVVYNTTTGRNYTIRKELVNSENINRAVSSTDCTSFIGAIRNIDWPPTEVTNENEFTTQRSFFTFKGTRNIYRYVLEDLGTPENINFTFKFISNQRKLPSSSVRCVNIVSSDSFLNDDLIAQSLMLSQTNGSNEDLTTGRILDVQYLPFSIATLPNDNFKIGDNSLIAKFLDMDDYQYVLDLPNMQNINKETDTIKIVSPSRASQYLYRPYDNDGNMEFSVKITLKPYTSSIYVRPSTKGLLIQDWDDKDCLIIQEDFSLTNVTSQWTNYIYNNRTYLNAFERQMQGREFERSWERRVEQAQARSDEWTARNISAQKARTYTGDLPIISGISGAIGSAVVDKNYMLAAQTDRQYNEALYQEGISISRDLFEYQMENIKSQPLIPSKVTTIDCKYLDGIYVEYYSTNETELQAISQYYRYNGNRIDSYGTFSKYWGPFVRGKIIISNNYTQPETDELNRRLEMGIFTEVS